MNTLIALIWILVPVVLIGVTLGLILRRLLDIKSKEMDLEYRLTYLRYLK